MGAGGGATVLSRQRGEIDNVALSALTKITADNLTAEKGARRLVLVTRSNSSTEISMIGVVSVSAALLTSTSSPPNRSSICASAA